jgi:ribulose 1,5-bisphosphate synthetase/thiazole synthase
MPTDVLIAGAGPIGLTATAPLTHYGLKCRINRIGLAQTFVNSGNE